MKKSILIVLTMLFPAVLTAAEVVEAVVARVGDRIITRSEYLRRLDQGYREIRQTAASAAEVEAQQAKLRDTLINDMLAELLLKDRADRMQLTVTEQELNEAVEVMKQRYGITTDDELRASLESAGLTPDQMKARLRETILTNKVFARELRGRNEIDDKELRLRYEREKERYRLPERAEVREIVLATADMEPGILEQRRRLAEEVAEKARNGVDFARLALDYSDSPTREKGGELGIVEKGELLQALDLAVFAAPAGTIAGPVETQYGLHILKVEKRIPSEVPGFEAVRQRLRQEADEETFQRDYKAYIEGLRKDAFIKIFEENIPTSGG